MREMSLADKLKTKTVFSMRQCITKPAKLVATGNHKVDIKVNGGKDLRPYTGNFIVPVLERYPEK